MTTIYPRCVHPGCFRTVTDFHRCWLHTLPEPVNAEPPPAYPSDGPMPEGVTEVDPW